MHSNCRSSRCVLGLRPIPTVLERPLSNAGNGSKGHEADMTQMLKLSFAV